MAAHTNEATICTVSTPFHKRLLYYNHQLTRALNSGHETPWIIVNNPEIHISRQRIRELLNQRGEAHNHKTYKRALYEEQRRYHDSVKMNRYIPGERILGGISLEEVRARLPQTSPIEGELQEQFDYRKDKTLQSYHHAFNLELALSKVKTRFAILLDPDLYVVRPNWLLELITRMKLEQLALFGVPWNPRYFQKFRYFPATHFMVIDFKKIPKDAVKLQPDLLAQHSNFEPSFWRKYLDDGDVAKVSPLALSRCELPQGHGGGPGAAKHDRPVAGFGIQALRGVQRASRPQDRNGFAGLQPVRRICPSYGLTLSATA